VIAEARYVLQAGGSAAEFAISVAQPWQGKGLARLMLGKLACRAAAAGVERFVGETLATNIKMQHLARTSGFTLRPGSQGVMLLEKVLPRSPGGDGAPCFEANGRAA
jgi:acetyltransferase